MASIHFILQKKGGVGKSLVSSFFTQYLKSKNYYVRAFDADPANHSFADFKDLKADVINILDSNNEIDARNFDKLIDKLCRIDDADVRGHAVIDTGSSCFIPLVAYIRQSDAFGVLESMGNSVCLHVPITGGSDIVHTSECFGELASQFPNQSIILWYNYYHGDLSFESVPFEDFDVCAVHGGRVQARIAIPNRAKTLFGRDIEMLMAKKMTFAESLNSNLPLMVRQRLKTFWNELHASIDGASCYFANVQLPDVGEDTCQPESV